MPSPLSLGDVPYSTSLTPTSENRGLPQRKAPHYHSPSRSNPSKPLNHSVAHVRQIRPLTVNEALQYSSLSSIVPYDSGKPRALRDYVTTLTLRKMLYLYQVPPFLTNSPSSQILLNSIRPGLYYNNLTQASFKISVCQKLQNMLSSASNLALANCKAS